MTLLTESVLKNADMCWPVVTQIGSDELKKAHSNTSVCVDWYWRQYLSFSQLYQQMQQRIVDEVLVSGKTAWFAAFMAIQVFL